MNAFVMLKKPEDWDKYKVMWTEAKLTSTSQTTIDWGKSPGSYPCLVSSYAEGPSGVGLFTRRIVSCFVTVHDAVSLVKEAQSSKIKQTGAQAGVSKEQAEFNRGIVCHVSAILKLLKDTSIVKEAVYRERYLAELSQSGQDIGQDHQTILNKVFGETKEQS